MASERYHRNLLGAPFTGNALAERAASGWGGEHVARLDGPGGHRTLVMRLVGDSETEVGEFRGVWPLYPRHCSVCRDGR